MKIEIWVTGDGGSPMGVCKMGKMGQKAKYRKIGENGQRVMNRNEKSPNFLFGINASILQPPHYVRKKMKKMLGDSQLLYQNAKIRQNSDFCSVVNPKP